MIKLIETTGIFDKNYNSKCPVVVNVGGARSGKSPAILQLFIQKFVNEGNKEFLIARKTLPALRRTAYRIFLNLFDDYGYYKQCIHNKTDLTIKIKNNTIDFLSVDNIEKIKSTEYNYIFLEEANEFSKLDYRIIRTRLSGQTTPNEPNKIFLALNPSDIYGWINQTLIHESGVEVINSSHLDNPFLSAEYRQILEDLEENDPELYRIYCLGEWAEISNIIYSNYIIESKFPDSFDDEFYGIDWGFNHPTALVFIGMKDNEVYLKEIVYQTHLTNQDVIKLFGENNLKKTAPIYGDSAEPARIEEIYKAGFNIHPATKSVMDGIDLVKRYKLHLLESDVNIIKEIRSYKWKEDKAGNILDEPVKYADDLLDATRYALFSHLHKEEKREIKFIPTSMGGGGLRG